MKAEKFKKVIHLGHTRWSVKLFKSTWIYTTKTHLCKNDVESRKSILHKLKMRSSCTEAAISNSIIQILLFTGPYNWGLKFLVFSSLPYNPLPPLYSHTIYTFTHTHNKLHVCKKAIAAVTFKKYILFYTCSRDPLCTPAHVLCTN